MKKPLTIGLLDFQYFHVSMPGRRSTSTKRVRSLQLLRNAVKDAGHIPRVYRVEKCQLYFDNRRSEVLYNNKEIEKCDVLIPYLVMSENTDLEVSLVKQFQMMGTLVLNEYLPITRAKNKLRTLQILTHNKIPVPRTLVVRKLEYIDEAIKKVGGYPVIIKSPYGTWGIGVTIVESRRSLYSAIDVLWKNMGSNIILIQEYVAEAEGTDYRAFVIGDKVVAAMRRTAPEGDFRSNLHGGGSAEKALLTPEEEKIAVKATQVMGLTMAGVDILRSKNGPVIMEVNSSPGIVGISQASGVDVAAKVIEYAAACAVKHQKSKNQKA